MKTIRTHAAVTVAVTLLGLASVSSAMDSSCPANCQGKIYKGSVSSVNTRDNTISVKSFFFTRTFNAGTNCKVSLQDKPMATLADLQPGERVDIRYMDDHGVYIAMNIAQHDLMLSGHITAIDPAARTMTMTHDRGLASRTFRIDPSCAVTMRGNKAGDLNNLQVGDMVHVAYLSQNGADLAKRITQGSDTYVGTIEAINANTRSVTAGDKRFDLANNCEIVVGGKMGGNLGDLRIGEEISLSYDNADGVLVANRISPVAPGSERAQSPKGASQNSNYTYTQPGWGY